MSCALGTSPASSRVPELSTLYALPWQTSRQDPWTQRRTRACLVSVLVPPIATTQSAPAVLNPRAQLLYYRGLRNLVPSDFDRNNFHLLYLTLLKCPKSAQKWVFI